MAKEFMSEGNVGVEEAVLTNTDTEKIKPQIDVSPDVSAAIKKLWSQKRIETKPIKQTPVKVGNEPTGETTVATLDGQRISNEQALDIFTQQEQEQAEKKSAQTNEITANKPQPVSEIKDGRIIIRDVNTGKELVNFPEIIRGGALDVAFTPGLANVAAVKGEVEDILRRREIKGEVEPDLRSSLTAALEKYRSPALLGGRLPNNGINNLLTEISVRMSLVEADGSLLVGNTAAFEKFAEQVGSLDEKGLRFLWNEWDRRADLQNLVSIMQNNQGAYFRGDPVAIANINAYIGVNPDREAVKRVAHALFRTTFMAAYYTGAVTPGMGGPVLIEEQILNNIDATIPAGVTGRNRYFAKKTRHQQMEQARRGGMITGFAPTINPEVSDTKGRKLMYFTEEANAKGIGKASSLRYAADTKLLDLVHANGFRNLSDYMSGVVTGLPTDSVRVVDWGSAVKGASEEVEKITTFLNEPLAGPIGDPQKLGDNLKPLNEVVGAGAKWKARVSQELEDYNASRLIESTIDYFNKRSPDRQRYFKDKPALGPEFRKLIIESLGGYMEPEAKKDLLKRKDKHLFWKIWQPTNDIARAGALWLIDILKKFFQTVTTKQ